MFKKVILGSIALISILNAEPTAPQTTNNEIEKLQFQKILQEKNDDKLKNSNLSIPPLDVSTSSNSDFNVIGTINIGTSKYCYLLIDSNKIIKATQGVVIKNKKIEDISEYGITISDKNKNTSYLPILTTQIQESDIIFSTRENKKQ